MHLYFSSIFTLSHLENVAKEEKPQERSQDKDQEEEEEE